MEKRSSRSKRQVILFLVALECCALIIADLQAHNALRCVGPKRTHTISGSVACLVATRECKGDVIWHLSCYQSTLWSFWSMLDLNR